MWRAGRTDREAGYTYPAALILLFAAALAVHSTSIPPLGTIQSEREAELLFRGLAYRDAIASYRNADGANRTLPARLQDLVADPRLEGRRHIRRLYDDPMPGGGWRIVQDPSGGIKGVVSTATGKPRRAAFFPIGLESFKDAETYQDWQFVFDQDDG